MKDHHMLHLMAHIYLAAALIKSDAPMAVTFLTGLLFGVMSIICLWRGK